MRKVPIDEATEPELRAFAARVLGMEIREDAKLETVRSRVKAAHDKPEIEVEDEPPKAEAAERGGKPRPVTRKQQAPEEGKVKIIIPVQEEPGGDEPVFVSVNGKGMFIPRGKQCEIAERYFEALKNAVRLVYTMDASGEKMNPVPREVPAYPFTRVA